MRLSPANAAKLPTSIARFAYSSDSQKTGIVHFGIGAFHRAHQAWYTDLAMDAGERDWAICGVSLRSRSVQDQLEPQSGLYTLTQRTGADDQTRLIGSVREVLFAPSQRGAVVARIASPDCRIVSFTVTEKGYARGEGGSLDMTQAAQSFYPLLTAALAERMERGLPGVTLLSCDNLADNGKVLQRLMLQWLAVHEPRLADWFLAECKSPSTMIDRIVPRSAPSDLAQLEARLGMEDRAAVFTEKFSQWVIEDDFAGPRPAWENHGVQMVTDVAPYETAKLRMLNGAHSLLAYCGLRRGHEFVHQAVADAPLRDLADRLMRKEAAPTIACAPDQDLDAYADQLMTRFANPALRHKLAQIAMDGSQKIPQRWLDTALWHQQHGNRVLAIEEAFSAWLWHLADGRFVDDPLGDMLMGQFAEGGAQQVIAACFNSQGIRAPAWKDHATLGEIFASSPHIKSLQDT